MSFTVVIPARYASTRLPGKALADIGGKPMIEHVVDRANESEATRVVVATDDERIANALEAIDCEVCMTRADHLSGSDRLAEVVQTLDFSDQDIIVNVQGDEPFVPSQLINQVANALSQSSTAAMATAAKPLVDEQEIINPNVVKVVFAQNGDALYFSRAPIPYARNDRQASAWHHIGIYSYRAGFLRSYHNLLPSNMELTESLEQLRVLDNGYKIVVETVDYETGVGVDTPEDLENARKLFAR
ncbi:3-deoxy-manno-octulosonate cytidylyltransferase [Arenicella xantha]|uniref:3-deoxy-manno-octulosonate cytidylyltransferase n=1 Tax=Arenicella xantha TaxID=644221 RepID=A0A395JME0_9GAMM|nr:3-deoxy-manno-octulosonate cytidylyltransferase [Arenicella xantha]RBP50828.1 3-deoxy-manno-octulosonate cytidylyltransferase (CMP-KDO synthetase) [Arenicella xantha]